MTRPEPRPRDAVGGASLRRVLPLALLAAAAVAIAACSIPVDERVTRIDQADFPDDLTEATTTTTTTTTTVPPTSTVVDGSVEVPEETTTTVPAIPTEVVTVYYTRGITDVMQPVEVTRPVDTPVSELIPLLERPSGISPLSTSVLPGLIDDIVVERGTATVLLDPDVLDRMTTPNQQRAIAQIVLTVTSFRTSDAGNIGFARFEVDGEGYAVFVPGFGGSSQEGEPLAFTDFSVLIASTPTPTTTTTEAPTSTTTTTTTTTEPPADVSSDG